MGIVDQEVLRISRRHVLVRACEIPADLTTRHEDSGFDRAPATSEVKRRAVSVERVGEAHRQITAEPVDLADDGEEVVEIALHASELRRRASALPSLEAFAFAVDAAVRAVTPFGEGVTERRRRDGVLPFDATRAGGVLCRNVRAR